MADGSNIYVGVAGYFGKPDQTGKVGVFRRAACVAAAALKRLAAATGRSWLHATISYSWESRGKQNIGHGPFGPDYLFVPVGWGLF